MAKKTTKSISFPTSEEILSFIEDTPGNVGKREIARAFSLNKEQKIELKKVLKVLKRDGQIQRQHGKHFTETKSLTPVAIVIIIGPDGDGDIRAKPSKFHRVAWDEGAAKLQGHA